MLRDLPEFKELPLGERLLIIEAYYFEQIDNRIELAIEDLEELKFDIDRESFGIREAVIRKSGRSLEKLMKKSLLEQLLAQPIPKPMRIACDYEVKI